jgi:hypothetical protein
MERYGMGEKIEPWVKNVDKFFDAANAKEEVAAAY